MNALEKTRAEQRKLLFVHLWKAAGTSLHQIFAQQLPGYVVVDAENRISAKMWLVQHPGVGGHFIWEHVAGAIDDIDVLSTVVLREPVARTISHFFFNRLPSLNKFGFIDSSSFDEALLKELERKTPSGFSILRNMQTSVLAGSARASDDPEEQFGAAMENLSRFDLVGVTEHLPQLIEKVGVGLASAVSNPSIPHLNKGKSQERAVSVSPETLRLVSLANDLDKRLYTAALDMSNAQAGRKTHAFAPRFGTFGRFGTGACKVLDLNAVQDDSTRELVVELQIRTKVEGRYYLGFRIMNSFGATVYGATTETLGRALNLIRDSTEQLTIRIQTGILGPGDYELDVSINDEFCACDTWNRAASFQITGSSEAAFVGQVRLQATVQ